MGCILYSDDIVLLSGSCYGVNMVDICSNYGRRFDIKCNPLKSQTRVFEEHVPLVCFEVK